MATLFEQAGYTKDTVFEVLVGDDIGRHIKLSRDDGSNCPYFKDIAGKELDCDVYYFDPAEGDLRVVENPKEDSLVSSVSNKLKFPLYVNTNGLSKGEVKDLTDKFVSLGAEEKETVGNTHTFWKYYGVDADNSTRFWDHVGYFGDDAKECSYEDFLKAFEESQSTDNEQQESESVDKPFPEGFIAWSGGEMPIPKGTWATVIYRDGERSTLTVGYDTDESGYKEIPDTNRVATTWTHSNDPGDIVAYKIEEESEDFSQQDVEENSEMPGAIKIEEAGPISLSSTSTFKFTVKGKFIIEQIGDSLGISVEDGEATFYQ